MGKGEQQQMSPLARTFEPRADLVRVQRTRPGTSAPRHAVFIGDFLHLGRPFAQLAAVMLDPKGSWLVAAEQSAAMQGFVLDAGEPHQYGSTVVIPTHLAPLAPEGLVPCLDADIELCDLGGNRCRLSLSGRYRVPPPRPNGSTDRLMVYRATEAAVRLLLSAIGEALEIL